MYAKNNNKKTWALSFKHFKNSWIRQGNVQAWLNAGPTCHVEDFAMQWLIWKWGYKFLLLSSKTSFAILKLKPLPNFLYNKYTWPWSPEPGKIDRLLGVSAKKKKKLPWEPLHRLPGLLEIDALDRFSAIFTKGDNFCNILLKTFFQMGTSLNGKNLLLRSKFFHFRVDHKWHGRQKHFWQSSLSFMCASLSIPFRLIYLGYDKSPISDRVPSLVLSISLSLSISIRIISPRYDKNPRIYEAISQEDWNIVVWDLNLSWTIHQKVHTHNKDKITTNVTLVSFIRCESFTIIRTLIKILAGLTHTYFMQCAIIICKCYTLWCNKRQL